MCRQKNIYENLRKRISSGEFPEGSRMPSVRELVIDYESSQGTIGQVLTKMRYEGLIRIEHGRGCFVNKKKVAMAPAMRHVIVCERGGGETLYKNFVSSFYAEFANRADIMVSLEDVCSNKFSSELLLDKITNMVQQNSLEAIFIDGEQSHAFSFEQLQKMRELTDNVYCYFNQKQMHRDANITTVCIDWYHIGYISVKHLLEIGCRNLLCLASGEIRQGMYDALEDSIIDAKMRVEKHEEFIKLIENSEIHFDGIFIRNDSNIAKVLPILNNHKYNPPHDVAIISLYDTYWSSAFDFDLTSINIQPEKIAKILTEMQKGERERMSQIVKPKLLSRQSTELFNP